jgi:hypothetical protein
MAQIGETLVESKLIWVVAIPPMIFQSLMSDHLSGTIIRGTPRLLTSPGNPHQHKAAKV